jgi:F-type H+-transporting ATPase subunit epsilon
MAGLPTKIQLIIVTRERRIVDTPVDEVVLPGLDGEIGVLPGHTPLLAMLRIGPMRYRSGTTIKRLVLSWGFAEVLPDRVIVLAETAVLPVEIDATAAEADRLAAERELARLSSNDPEFAIAEAKLEESVAKISVSREL